MKPNRVVHVKCENRKHFYRVWMELLAPWHHLTSREQDVAARILAQYFRLKENIADDEVLKEVLWSSTSRKDMMESLKMKPEYFQIVLAKLKTSGFIVDGNINKRYLPVMTQDPRFLLSIVYDWSTPKSPVDV